MKNVLDKVLPTGRPKCFVCFVAKKKNVTLQAANGNLPVCLLHCENGHTCTKSRSGGQSSYVKNKPMPRFGTQETMN